MADKITFELDGRDVEADEGETIWQVAQRHGTEIPTCAGSLKRATGRTATAVPAWSKLKANEH